MDSEPKQEGMAKLVLSWNGPVCSFRRRSESLLFISQTMLLGVLFASMVAIYSNPRRAIKTNADYYEIWVFANTS